MPTQLYLYNSDTAGYALDDTGAGYNFSDLYSAGIVQIQVAAVARDNPDVVYVFDFDGQYFGRSSDAGLTWTILSSTPWPNYGEAVPCMVCHQAGDVHIFQDDSVGGNYGIWRSIDSGTTWTHIVTMPAAAQVTHGGFLAAGSTRLWYAEFNTPLVGGLPPTDHATYDIKSCHWDGTDIVTHGSTTFTPYVNYVKVRAIDDSLCVAFNPYQNLIYKITSTSTVTNISPSLPTGGIWDVVVFDATTYVAAGPAATSLDVRVYRTTDGGTSWTLVQTIPELEGFAGQGKLDLVLMDVVPGSTTAAYMYGYAFPDTRPYVWKTADAGQTWTSFRNLAALTDTGGDYLELGFGGVAAARPPAPLVTIPARLATIVG